MLLYVSKLRSDAEPEKILDLVYRWLQEEMNEKLPRYCMDVDYQKRFAFAQGFMSAVEISSYPEYRVFECRLVDGNVRARYFKLELALVQYDLESVTDIFLRFTLEDMSIRVQEAVKLVQPGLVEKLFLAGSLSSKTASSAIYYLCDEATVLEYIRLVEDPYRNLPVVLVSSLRGEYLVDIERLQLRLLGVAHLCVVERTAGSRKLQELLPLEYFAFAGAVNIILAQPLGGSGFKSFRYLSDQLLAFGEEVETEILSYVLHYTNRQLTWKHFSLVDLRHEQQQRNHKRSRLGLDEHWLQTNEARGLTDFYEDFAASQDDLIHTLRVERDELSFKLEELALQLDDMQHRDEEKNRLITSLRLIESYSSKLSDLSFEPRMRDYLVRLLNLGQENDFPSVREVLELVAYMFSDRLVVLDSAYKSATEMDNFRAPDILFERLFMLVTRYYEAFKTGGDVLAHTSFGYNAFAASVSGSAQKNSQALAELTFIFRGEPIVMRRHLRIGIRTSKTATIRVYFDLVESEGTLCIVIGYCGEHLAET